MKRLKLMHDKNIGALLVVDDDVLKGILSERDYAKKVVLKDKSSKDTLVHEIMDMDFTAAEYVTYPDHHKLAGIVSIGDVVQAIIEVQKDTIEHLNSYITQ